jgi:pimeloyl-ACP methyl ester carboxylesterase
MMLGDWGIRRAVRILYARQPIPDGVEEITLTMMKHFNARMGTLPLFSDDELRRLTMPVLLVGGDEDALRDNRRIAARLADLLPDLTVEMIPGGGHALLNTVGMVLGWEQGELGIGD